MIKSIEEANIKKGARVLIRTDWNLPVTEAGDILDNSRLIATTKSIAFGLEKKAKIIVMSHLGDGKDSLKIVVAEAQKFFPNTQIKFVADPFSEEGKNIVINLQDGEIAVLENLRFWEKEKDNNYDFAKNLAALGDIYINEAFPSSHRRHASIVGVPKFLPHFAGFRFMEEYQKLSLAFNPEHPFLFILGGAKFETKLPLVEKFLTIADHIFIGGEIAFHVLSLPLAQNPKIILPIGDITALDASAETLAMLSRKIKEAKFILWNGPLGNYENDYKEGTLNLTKMLAESNAKVIIGGGDTVATIKELDLQNKFYFVSLSGGAMLDFLGNGTLPGIEALQ